MAAKDEGPSQGARTKDSKEYQKDFRWCLEALSESCVHPRSPTVEEREPFRMIDTILLSERRAQLWLQTSNTGTLVTRVDSNSDPIMTKDVIEMLDTYLVQNIEENPDEIYAQIISETEQMERVTATEYRTLYGSSLPIATAIQPHIPQGGLASSGFSFRFRITTEETNNELHRCTELYQYVDYLDGNGPVLVGPLTREDTQATEIQQAVLAVSRTIEEQEQCFITTMDFDFLVDRSEHVWLSRVSNVKVALLSGQMPQTGEELIHEKIRLNKQHFHYLKKLQPHQEGIRDALGSTSRVLSLEEEGEIPDSVEQEGIGTWKNKKYFYNEYRKEFTFDDDDDNDLETSSFIDSEMKIPRWEDVLSNFLEKIDFFELESLGDEPNPPPAIKLIMSALTLLSSGSSLGWSKVATELKEGTFIQRLQSLRDSQALANSTNVETTSQLITREDMAPDRLLPQHFVAGCSALFLWVSLLECGKNGKFSEAWLTKNSKATVREISRMNSNKEDIYQASFDAENKAREDKLSADVSARFSRHRKVPALHIASSTAPESQEVPKYYLSKFQRDLMTAADQLQKSGFSLPPHLQALYTKQQKMLEQEDTQPEEADDTEAKERAFQRASREQLKTRKKQKRLMDSISPYHSVSMSQLQHYNWDQKTIKRTHPQKQDRESRTLPKMDTQLSSTPSTTARTASPSKQSRIKCAEGQFRLPYIIIGNQDPERKSFNFVFINDIFDDIHQFQQIIPSNILESSRVLLVNLPKQAGTHGKSMTNETLSTGFYAECLAEVLEKLNDSGKFFTTAAAADAALKQVNEVNQRKTGGTAKMKFTDDQGNMLPQAMPQKFHIVSFGYGAAIATKFVKLFGKQFRELLGSVVLINGFLHVSPNMKQLIENSMELFGSFPDSASDIPFTHIGKLFLANATETALCEFDKRMNKSLTHSAYIDLLDSALNMEDLRWSVPQLGVPVILWDTKSNRFVDCPLSKELHVLEKDIIDDEDPKLDVYCSPYCWRIAGKELPGLSYEEIKHGCKLDYYAIDKIKSGLRSSRAIIALKTDGGHYVPQEKCIGLWQLLTTLSNPEQTLHLFEREEEIEVPQDSPEDWQKVVDIASGGIINPLRTLNPGEREEFKQRQNFTLDGRPKEDSSLTIESKVSRRRSQESSMDSTTVPQPENSPELHSTEGDFFQSPDAREEAEGRTGENDADENLIQATTFPTAKTDEEAEEKEEVSLEPLSAFGITYPELNQRRTKPAIKQEELTINKMARSQKKRIKNWKKDDKEELDKLQETAMANRIAQNAERQEEKDEQKKTTSKDRGIARLERELTKLERQSGVILYGTRGPNVEYFPDASGGLRKGSKPHFGYKPAPDSQKSDVIDLEAGKVGKTAADTVPLPGQRRLTNEQILKLSKKETRLEQLAPESLPGIAEVHPFSPLGKALDLIRIDGKVHGDKHKERKINDNPSAAEASYLQLATFKDMKEHQKNLGPSRDPLPLIGDENFEEFLYQNDIYHELYLQRQAKLTGLRAAASQRAIDYDSPATVIQKIIRGYLGRKRAKELWVLVCLYKMQKQASIMIQKLIRGFLCRRRYISMRTRMLRLWTIQRSAEKIQIAYRHHVFRCKFMAERWNSMATKIQRVARGHMGRLRFARTKARFDRIKRSNTAATLIQAHFRRWIAQKDYRELLIWNLSAITLQRHWKGCVARRLMSTVEGFDRRREGLNQVVYGSRALDPELERLRRKRESLSLSRFQLFREEYNLKKLTRDKKQCIKSQEFVDNEFKKLKDKKQQVERMIGQQRSLELAIRSDESFLKENGAELSERRKRSLTQQKEVKEEELSELIMAINLKEASVNKEEQGLHHRSSKLRNKVEELKQSITDSNRKIGNLRRRIEKEIDQYGEVGIKTNVLRKRQLKALQDDQVRSKTAPKKQILNGDEGRTDEVQGRITLTGPLADFKRSLDGIYKQAASLYATQSAIRSSFVPETKKDDQYELSFSHGYERVLSETDKRLIYGVEREKKQNSASIERRELVSSILEHTDSTKFNSSIRFWTVEDMCRWLRTADLAEYEDIFRSRDIDGDTFTDLSNEDIKEVLGIRAKAHLHKIQDFRNRLNEGYAAEYAMRTSQSPSLKRQDVGKARSRLLDLSKNAAPSIEKFFSWVKHCRIGPMKSAMETGFDPDSKDRSGKTALHIASSKAQLNAVKALVSFGANVNETDGQGNAALHYAVAYDPSREVVKYLLSHGADSAQCNGAGREAIEGI